MFATLSARVTSAFLRLARHCVDDIAAAATCAPTRVYVALSRTSVADEESVISVADSDIFLATTATTLAHSHLTGTIFFFRLCLRIVVVLRSGEDGQIIIRILILRERSDSPIFILLTIVASSVVGNMVGCVSTSKTPTFVATFTSGSFEQVVLATFFVAQINEVAITCVDGVVRIRN